MNTSLRSTILCLLADPCVDRRMGRSGANINYFVRAVLDTYPEENRPSHVEIHQLLWQSLGRGLVWIEIDQPAPENWKWALTNQGLNAAQDEQFNPDDPDRYIKRLKERIPDVTDLVILYAEEAIACYGYENYLASAVMLGVASEAAFLELAESSVSWFGSSGVKLGEILSKTGVPYTQKLNEFKKRLEPKRGEIPSEFIDGIDLTVSSVLDMYRVTRNDTGHPTGINVNREDQYISLQMFGRYLEKLYLLKNYFNSK